MSVHVDLHNKLFRVVLKLAYLQSDQSENLFFRQESNTNWRLVQTAVQFSQKNKVKEFSCLYKWLKSLSDDHLEVGAHKKHIQIAQQLTHVYVAANFLCYWHIAVVSKNNVYANIR